VPRRHEEWRIAICFILTAGAAPTSVILFAATPPRRVIQRFAPSWTTPRRICLRPNLRKQKGAIAP
jgi:hypothetical protein